MEDHEHYLDRELGNSERLEIKSASTEASKLATKLGSVATGIITIVAAGGTYKTAESLNDR